MVSPKDARRRQQLQARERKRLLKDKKLAKKQATRAPASLHALMERWMRLDPSRFPLEETCPGCGGRVGAEAHGDELVHLHEYPHCAAYQAFARVTDEADAEGDSPGREGGISIDEVASRMFPAWTHGPHTEITEEEGDALLESGEVLQFWKLLDGLPDTFAVARTAKGLFRWPTEPEDEYDGTDLAEQDVLDLATEVLGDDAVDDWLRTPNVALEGKSPMTMLDTIDDIKAVERVLNDLRKQ